jgi:predicted HTH domain antitoxin
MNITTLNLEIPSELLLSLKVPKQQWDNYIRQTLAVELYREEKLSLGKAKELAGLSTKWEMIQLLTERGVALNYSTDDWQSDLKTLDELFS